MFESAPAEVLGYTKPDLWQWFEDHDYAVFLPNRLAHAAPPMTLELFLDSHQYPRRATNYFGVPSEKIAEVRERASAILRQYAKPDPITAEPRPSLVHSARKDRALLWAKDDPESRFTRYLVEASKSRET
jgi:hypothetical protein